MSDGLDFLPLRKADFHDAGDRGLAMRLETEETPDHRVFVFGCFLNAEQGTQLLQELAKALEKKYPSNQT